MSKIFAHSSRPINLVSAYYRGGKKSVRKIEGQIFEAAFELQ